MITKPVTREQLNTWKALSDSRIHKLRPNRIPPAALIAYFNEHYAPTDAAPDNFREVIVLNARDRGTAEPQAEVFTYDGDVWVGFDRVSGFFQVESENTEKAARIWDDLFLHAGLDADDLKNVVITGQYLELMGKKR